MEQFDYIIVGAGSAGCVLANRLSADPACRVALIEAGEDTHDLLIESPLTWMQAAADPRFGWGFEAEPDPGLDGRTQPVPRGRVMGGCSSINGTMYIRGAAADYDQWRDAGNPGWGYDDILPLFRLQACEVRGKHLLECPKILRGSAGAPSGAPRDGKKRGSANQLSLHPFGDI